jgi:hypothetical protein
MAILLVAKWEEIIVDPGLKSWNRLLDFFVKAYGAIQNYRSAVLSAKENVDSSGYLTKRG